MTAQVLLFTFSSLGQVQFKRMKLPVVFQVLYSLLIIPSIITIISCYCCLFVRFFFLLKKNDTLLENSVN